MVQGQDSRGRRIAKVVVGSLRVTYTALRILLTAMSVASVATWAAWLATGRLDDAWPIRNRVEHEARGIVAHYLPPIGTETRAPGSISGRVLVRLPDVTPTATAEPTPESAASVSDIAQFLVSPVSTVTVQATRTLVPTSTPAGTPVATPTARLGPVSGATVLIADAEANVVESITDSSGTFTLSGVDGGRYQVAVSAPGYASTVIDRPASRDPIDRLFAWLMPGIEVAWNGDAPIEVVLERPPEAQAVSPRETTLLTGTAVAVQCENPVTANVERVPVDFVGPDNASGMIWKYVAVPADIRSGASMEVVVPRPVVVAAIPTPLTTSDCALAGLASGGIDVFAITLSLGTRAERDIRLIRMLIATVRQPSRTLAPGTPGSTQAPPNSRRDPFILGAGSAALHALRAVRDEPVGAIPGVILVSAPVDLFAMRRHAASSTEFPKHLNDYLVGLGPADREIARYLRYSAQYNLSDVIPPTMIVHHRSDPTVPFAPVARYSNTLARMGVPLDTVFIEEGAPGFLDDRETGEMVLARIRSFIDAHVPAIAGAGSR